jgi:NADP-dependent 3-hydroxy acid dehydrogenase YdfG
MEERDTPDKIVKATLDKFGKIDVLINNAGAASKPGKNAMTDSLDLDNLDFLYDVNLRA